MLNRTRRYFESVLLTPSSNSESFTNGTLKTELPTEKRELTIIKHEETTPLRLTTQKVEFTAVKKEMTTQMPEVTTLQVKSTTLTSDLTTVREPTTTFKYNFTLIHETWPTVFNNAKIPKSNVKRVVSDYQQQNKTILTQPLVMPPTMSGPNSSDGARYLVYVCDGGHMCGGLGDRQRTILSLYVLSRIVNRRLIIKINSPCDISHFFVPFKVQWLPPPDLDPPSKDNTIYEMTTGTGLQFVLSLNSGDFNTMYTQRVLYLITNIDMFEYYCNNPLYSSVFKQ